MDIVISILAFVWSILFIILFFKVWGMTNDVRELKTFILSNAQKNVKEPTKGIKEENGEERFLPDTLVVEISTGRQMRIKNKLPNGKYECSYNHGLFVTEIEASDLVTFEEYQKNIKQ